MQIHAKTLAFRTPGAKLVAVSDIFEEAGARVVEGCNGMPKYYKVCLYPLQVRWFFRPDSQFVRAVEQKRRDTWSLKMCVFFLWKMYRDMSGVVRSRPMLTQRLLPTPGERGIEKNRRTTDPGIIRISLSLSNPPRAEQGWEVVVNDTLDSFLGFVCPSLSPPPLSRGERVREEMANNRPCWQLSFDLFFVLCLCSSLPPSLSLSCSVFSRGEQDWKEMVNDPEVGAIVVGSPTPFHAEQIIEAAKLGKHIFCALVRVLGALAVGYVHAACAKTCSCCRFARHLVGRKVGRCAGCLANGTRTQPLKVVRQKVFQQRLKQISHEVVFELHAVQIFDAEGEIGSN